MYPYVHRRGRVNRHHTLMDHLLVIWAIVATVIVFVLIYNLI